MADTLFFMPAERDEELVKGERKRLIRGIASTESKDSHGEEIVLSGMDFDPYLEKGFLNWDHKTGPQHLLGKPIEAKIVSDASKFKKGLSGPGFYHLCELFDTEPGRAAWEYMIVTEKDPKRKPGYSVEGAVLGTKGAKLIKTRVEDCALTPKPANKDTFAEFAKSLTATGSPELELQNVDDNQSSSGKASMALTGVDLEALLWGDCQHGCFDKKKRFQKGAVGAYIHLVKCHGHDEDSAHAFVKSLASSGIF